MLNKQKRYMMLTFALIGSLGLTAVTPPAQASQTNEAVTTTQATKLFKDISATHVYANEIYTMREKNIINGYEDNTFRPNSKITRKHAAALVYRAVQYAQLTISKPTVAFFAPVDVATTDTYYTAIKYLMERNLLNVDKDRNINLNVELTRGEMANIIATVFDLDTKATYTFSDTAGTNYEKAVEKLYTNGITTGYEDGTFRPNETLTRAHYTLFMYRALAIATEVLPEMKPVVFDDTSEPIKIGYASYVPSNHVFVDTSKHNPTYKTTIENIKTGFMTLNTDTSQLTIKQVNLTHPTLGLPKNYVKNNSTIMDQVRSLNVSPEQQAKNHERAMKIHKERKFRVQGGGPIYLEKTNTDMPISVKAQSFAGSVGVSVNQYIASYEYVMRTGNFYDGGTYALYIYNNSISAVSNNLINHNTTIYDQRHIQ
ncbi:S-layer homology domain-containing protein [Caryophanon latum]|uniref:SLH domain-containing protein n=1 Tax=Caryophanon latum TaxID=33977 RepID=A0A1C0YR87_9BACL|nr:S-layer homology domain-containing protein [Caryophanon latum]OCS89680.1 hypothetical protein A6K76_12195 [Caryophanon latum]